MEGWPVFSEIYRVHCSWERRVKETRKRKKEVKERARIGPSWCTHAVGAAQTDCRDRRKPVCYYSSLEASNTDSPIYKTGVSLGRTERGKGSVEREYEEGEECVAVLVCAAVSDNERTASPVAKEIRRASGRHKITHWMESSSRAAEGARTRFYDLLADRAPCVYERRAV